jgi:hypothetical protein
MELFRKLRATNKIACKNKYNKNVKDKTEVTQMTSMTKSQKVSLGA